VAVANQCDALHEPHRRFIISDVWQIAEQRVEGGVQRLATHATIRVRMGRSDLLLGLIDVRAPSGDCQQKCEQHTTTFVV